MTATPSLRLAGEPEADQLLAEQPLALLIGILLDQQVPMESAFAGPKKLADRLGGLDARSIAQADPDEFASVFATSPAVHRFPGSMAKRVQALCQTLLDKYDGRAEGVWSDGDPDGREVLRRLKGLPGFGDQKAQVFLALLGKQLGVRPEGWREAAGRYGQEGTRLSTADVVDEQTRAEMRETKKSS
ncbi:putative HhH-GPD family protein [Lipingzhangella halophila]|uniref:Putative HhH-GPD family protein n=1 Tax=Lipingzhangella halophila TaxID=1783352 RepID=A0A7W7RGI4_9ACTN|nr:HhH-GPD-type base excision DNA repair protein [Lipingzhangella halophila]MBB4931569.1 putative HhH-GPD family protein [Lipingzhangella halophila]